MLKHSLREAAQAEKLEQAKPEPCLLERCARYRISVTNVAACIAILFLTKAGIFSSFDRLHTRGEAALKQYYTHQARRGRGKGYLRSLRDWAEHDGLCGRHGSMDKWPPEPHNVHVVHEVHGTMVHELQRANAAGDES